MYQPNHATTEIGRMRAEEMRARAERYRTIQKAKQHKKAESEEEEESLSHSRTFVYRKALGIVGLSVLMVLAFAAAALAMPADAGPTGVDDKHQALVSQPQVREGPPSFWAAQSASVGGQERAEMQHLGEAQPATVAGLFGGQERADIQHVGEAQPATVAGLFGGQERAAIQHVGEADQPSTFNPAPGLSPSSGGIELELVLLLSGTVALASLGALVWFRRHSIRPA